MTTKFTPSPWEYDGKFTVSIPHAKGDTHFRTNPEDACLIWQAPNLYEALTFMTAAFKPFTLRPIGGEGSQARLEQEAQNCAHAIALEVLRKASP